jgi:hypothetical protein
MWTAGVQDPDRPVILDGIPVRVRILHAVDAGGDVSGEHLPTEAPHWLRAGVRGRVEYEPEGQLNEHLGCGSARAERQPENESKHAAVMSGTSGAKRWKPRRRPTQSWVAGARKPPAGPRPFVKLRGRDSNPDYLIQSQASYH